MTNLNQVGYNVINAYIKRYKELTIIMLVFNDKPENPDYDKDFRRLGYQSILPYYIFDIKAGYEDSVIDALEELIGVSQDRQARIVFVHPTPELMSILWEYNNQNNNSLNSNASFGLAVWGDTEHTTRTSFSGIINSLDLYEIKRAISSVDPLAVVTTTPELEEVDTTEDKYYESQDVTVWINTPIQTVVDIVWLR